MVGKVRRRKEYIYSLEFFKEVAVRVILRHAVRDLLFLVYIKKTTVAIAFTGRCVRRSYFALCEQLEIDRLEPLVLHNIQASSP